MQNYYNWIIIGMVVLCPLLHFFMHRKHNKLDHDAKKYTDMTKRHSLLLSLTTLIMKKKFLKFRGCIARAVQTKLKKPYLK